MKKQIYCIFHYIYQNSQDVFAVFKTQTCNLFTQILLLLTALYVNFPAITKADLPAACRGGPFYIVLCGLTICLPSHSILVCDEDVEGDDESDDVNE